jgi:hypothetical protein
MIHSAALGLMLAQPVFSLDMSVGARLNPCTRRLYRAEPDMDESAFLLRLLGIERVLVAKRFTYQDSFTPATTRVRMGGLEDRIEAIARPARVVFENAGVKLVELPGGARPTVRAATRVRAVARADYAACRFPQDDANADFADASSLPREVTAGTLHSAAVTAKAMQPGRYAVHVAGLTSAPTVLVLNETFADWVLAGTAGPIAEGRARRFPVDGYATAWWLDAPSLCGKATCDADFEIRYAPQARYGLLLALFVILALGAGALLARETRAARRR